MTKTPLLLALTAAALLTGPALAQNNPGNNSYYGVPDFSDNGQQPEQSKTINQYSNKYKKTPIALPGAGNSLLPQRQFQLFFVRTPQSGPQEATLRLLSPYAVNGCVAMTPPVVEQERKGKTLWYTVSDASINIAKADHHKTKSCRQNAGFAFADIPLHRETLQQHGITQIAFKTGTAVDYYDLSLADSRISLLPKSTVAFKPRSGDLSQWLFPESMLILYVPSAKDQPDISSKVRALAQARGLIDAETAVPGFRQPAAQAHEFYFLDPSLRFAGRLNNQSSDTIGTIEGAETFFGPQGPYERPKQMAVYARRPGLND